MHRFSLRRPFRPAFGVAKPRFQHEEVPELLRRFPVSSGLSKCRDYPVTAYPTFAFQQTLPERFLDLVPPFPNQPTLDRNPESALRTVSDAVAQPPPRQFSQYGFELPAPQADVKWQPGRELPQPVIEKW